MEGTFFDTPSHFAQEKEKLFPLHGFKLGREFILSEVNLS